MNAFALFNNDEQYDISLLMAGKADRDVARFIIDDIAEVRRDMVAFVSPQHTTTGDPIIGKNSDAVEEIIKYKNGDGALMTSLPSSSYVVYDTGYKYQYDRYNDKYRWIPLNGDIAGLCARTDYTDDSWFSPAGFNRGQIKNVIKLGYNPRKADRGNLYVAGINPVVSFPGEGVVLFGDKTGLAKPSAFDRINVRRLFITLEKAISTAAKYQLFEFNDGFTRAQFRNQVEPFLRDVKGRRGILDFKVVCDETNNTADVIDRGEFVGSIYLKPTRSIQRIRLDYIVTKAGVNFSEISL
jgi:phage tail sheath protein FI